MKLQKTKSRFAGMAYATTIIAALAAIAFGAWGLWQWYQATHGLKPAVTSEIVTHTTSQPSETPPLCDDYSVPAGQPRKIILPSLKKSGCIEKVGVDQKKAIAAPESIHTAGWFVDSSLPGDEGVSIIDGHVSGRYDRNAIFSSIKNLKKGDKIKVEFGDHKQRVFSVVSIDNYSVKRTTKEQFRQLDGVDRQLNLITCGGSFNSDTQHFDERTIVRAELVG